MGSVTSIQAIIGGTADFENAYTYDNLQRITRFDQGEYGSGNTVAEKRFDFFYSAASAFTRIDRYADLAGGEYVASTHYAYDGIGRLLRLTHNDGTSSTSGFGTNPLAGYQFAYDAASRFTSINSYLDGSTTYTHDDTSQLTTADHTGMSDESYAYDANGNRTGGSIDNDPNNQLASDGTYNYTYDAEGNRLTKTKISNADKEEYTWDHRNRLTLITFKNSGGTVIKTVAQTYDVNNRWIRRTVDPDGATGSAVNQETFFSHLDGQIALEFDGTTAGDLSHRYAWNPSATDQLLADENALNEITR
jgi:YD repeat-containing protein